MKECSVRMETNVSEIQIETKDEKRPVAASPQKERQERKKATLCFKRRKKVSKTKAKAGAKSAEEAKKHASEAGGSGQRPPAGAWASIKRLVTHRKRSESGKKQKPSEGEVQPEDGTLPKKKAKSRLKIPCIRFSRGAKRSRRSKLTEDSGYVRVQGEADDLETKAQTQPDDQAIQARSTQDLQGGVSGRDGKEIQESHISNSVTSGENVIAIELELENESSAIQMGTQRLEKETKVITEKQSVQAQQSSLLESSAAGCPRPVTSAAPPSPATTRQRSLEGPSDGIRESVPSGKDDKRRKTAAEDKKSGETALDHTEEAAVGQADKSALSQAEEDTAGHAEEATEIQTDGQAKEGTVSQAEEATVARAKETVLSQAEGPAVSQAKTAVVGQANKATIGQAEEAKVGHTEKATVDQAEEATVGHTEKATGDQAEEATVDQAEEATGDQAEEATVCQEEEATVGQAEEATIGHTEEATVGQAEEATIGHTEKATVDQVEEATVGQAEETTVGWAEEATVGKAEKATVGQAEKAVLSQAEEATVGKAEEAPVDQAEEATVGQAEKTVLSQAEEATVGKAEEAPVDQAEEATVGQAEKTVLSQAEEATVGKAEEAVLSHALDLKENGIDTEKPRSEESKRMEPIAIIITDTEISEFDVKKSKNVPKQFLISMENEQVGVFANDSDFEGRTSEQYETLLIETASSLVKNAIELSVEQLVNEMVSEDNQINTLLQ
ncbi:A-kinase anchor protein 5 [Mastomys coucha]|uniref:A-kinase anchor protein 5 n=1 Tax=Mastomys coucha TaxID=35658 RepID=UPI001261FA89|nr:A-kinase anchor protein 5 [Mastomys coucha]XP_031212284.1 A-kinase anchor protein 5 [Mastomys coucha]